MFTTEGLGEKESCLQDSPDFSVKVEGIQKEKNGVTSLVVQRLGLHTPNARARFRFMVRKLGPICHNMLRQRPKILCATTTTQRSQIKKY